MAARRGGFGREGGAAGAGDGGAVQFGDDRFEFVVSLADGRGTERIGLNDVGTGRKIVGVNFFDDVGTREAEEIVVALEVVREVREAGATEIGFLQGVGLDHRTHRAIEDGDALGKDRAKRGGAGSGGRGWVLDGRGHEAKP